MTNVPNFNLSMQLSIIRIKLIALTQVRGHVAKGNLLKVQDCQELRAALKWAYDPYRTFGVPIESKGGAWFVRGEEVAAGNTERRWTDAEVLLNALASRALTGNEAAEAVRDFVSGATPTTIALMAGILNKDMALGIGPKTINKAFPGLVPIYEVAKGELASEYPPDWNESWFAEVKYDGERCQAWITKEEGVVLRSANGLEIDGHERLRADIYRGFPSGYVLDGELMVGRTGVKNKDSATFVAFDLFEGKAFTDGNNTDEFRKRRANLVELEAAQVSNLIVLSRGREVYSQEEADELFNEVVEAGGEGTMLKRLDSANIVGRSQEWLKVKPVKEGDFNIVSTYEGKGGTGIEGLLGGIVIEDANGVRTEVGSGFTMEERVKYAGAEAFKLLGRTATVHYTAVLPSGKLQFGRVHPGWLRQDKHSDG